MTFNLRCDDTQADTGTSGVLVEDQSISRFSVIRSANKIQVSVYKMQCVLRSKAVPLSLETNKARSIVFSKKNVKTPETKGAVAGATLLPMRGMFTYSTY
jgi:hypothetical protein